MLEKAFLRKNGPECFISSVVSPNHVIFELPKTDHLNPVSGGCLWNTLTGRKGRRWGVRRAEEAGRTPTWQTSLD